MSSKQEDYNHQIEDDQRICLISTGNFSDQSSQVAKPSCTAVYVLKLKNIAKNFPQHLRNKEKRLHIPCIVATLTIIVVITLITASIIVSNKSSEKATPNILNETLRRVVLMNTRELDFESIPQSVEELEINSLLLISPYTPKVEKNKFIRKLILSSPTSERWIEFLLTTFPEVDTLILNEDEMCGFRNLAANENFPTLALPKLATMRISNVTGKCDLTRRIFSKWSLNNLKNLSFTQSNIHDEYYVDVHKFLSKLKASIETFEINKSVLCKECDFVFLFTDGYDKLKKISISRVIKAH